MSDFLPIYTMSLLGCRKLDESRVNYYLEDFSFVFSTEDGLPALPLRGYGELYQVGQASFFVWAVDAAGQCWLDDAPDGTMIKVAEEELLDLEKVSFVEIENDSEFMEYEKQNEISALLGRKPRLPDWAEKALKAGWQPHSSWNKDDFQE